MSYNHKFNKLTKKQTDEKKRLWAEISEELGDEEVIQNVKPAKQRFWTVKKITAVCTSILVIAIIGVSISFNFNIEETPRFCCDSEYYTNFSEYTLEEYSVKNGNKILNFNIETQSSNYYEFKLYSTNETVCFMAELMDDNEVIIDCYITDIKTEIEALNTYKEVCIDSVSLSGVKLMYGVSMKEAYGCFTYNGYNYYITIDMNDKDYVITLCNNLLSDK